MMTTRILPVLCIILAIGLFVFYVNPTYAGPVAASKAQIASFTSALDASTRFKEKEAELERARAQISPESLARLESFLPDGVDNVQLILDLDALAARSGVKLSNFDVSGSQSKDTGSTTGGAGAVTTPQGPGAGTPTGGALGTTGGFSLQTSDPIDSIELTVSATGTYTAFRSFLGALEQSLRPLDVIDVQVHQSATGVYTYDMTIRIYWLR